MAGMGAIRRYEAGKREARRSVRFRLAIAALALTALAGGLILLGRPSLAPTALAPTALAPTALSPVNSATNASSTPTGTGLSELTCGPSDPWPPNGYPPAPAGVSAFMPDRVSLRISNDTQRDYWFVVSGWERDGCRGYVANQMKAGLVSKQSETLAENLTTIFAYRVGVEISDQPCGLACHPIGFISVPFSTVQPYSS
jgi:hypothetical protein